MLAAAAAQCSCSRSSDHAGSMSEVIALDVRDEIRSKKSRDINASSSPSLSKWMPWHLLISSLHVKLILRGPTQKKSEAASGVTRDPLCGNFGLRGTYRNSIARPSKIWEALLVSPVL